MLVTGEGRDRDRQHRQPSRGYKNFRFREHIAILLWLETVGFALVSCSRPGGPIRRERAATVVRGKSSNDKENYWDREILCERRGSALVPTGKGPTQNDQTNLNDRLASSAAD